MNSRVYPIFKRGFDIVVSTVGILFLLPLFILISLLIVINDPGPVFYRGERVGRLGKPFRIYKFRTMVVEAEKIGPSSTSQDDPRLLKIGKFLRKYKLDELPQLFNVWLGEMSFVGPRPEVKKFVDKYSAEEKKILTLRPGITDWASLRFPNEDEILKAYENKYRDADEAYEMIIRPEKLRLQLEYLHNYSFKNDIKIIFKTIIAILTKIVK